VGQGGLRVLAGLVAGLWLRGVTEGAFRPGLSQASGGGLGREPSAYP
jgi:hypothetical protein